MILTKRFLNYWKPTIAIFVDSEIWPSMTLSLKKNQIPLILLNARITKRSFKRWMKFKNFANFIFNQITITYPQNKDTKYFLKKLRLNKIKEIGNLKLIENNKDKNNQIDEKLRSQFKKQKTWIAASTHDGEEKFCAMVHIQLKKK